MTTITPLTESAWLAQFPSEELAQAWASAAPDRASGASTARSVVARVRVLRFMQGLRVLLRIWVARMRPVQPLTKLLRPDRSVPRMR